MLGANASVGDVLAGRRILVVEDDFLTADEIVRTLRGTGAEILGAVPTVETAMALIQSAPRLDAAVIDVRLAGELAYPIAEALIVRETPFVFTTIYRRDELPERFHKIPHCAKPMQPPILLRRLQEALDPGEQRDPSGPPGRHEAKSSHSAGRQAPSPEEVDDIGHWVERIARHSDPDAFNELFIAVAPRVKAYMLRSGMPASVAEELAQDVLLTVWLKAELFDPDRAAAMVWIFTIARNRRIDLHRRDHQRDPSLPDWTVPQPQLTPEEIVCASIETRRINEALGELPPQQAQVMRRFFLDGQAHAEIAHALGLPLGTVKSRLRLAIARLRSKQD